MINHARDQQFSTENIRGFFPHEGMSIIGNKKMQKKNIIKTYEAVS